MVIYSRHILVVVKIIIVDRIEDRYFVDVSSFIYDVPYKPLKCVVINVTGCNCTYCFQDCTKVYSTFDNMTKWVVLSNTLFRMVIYYGQLFIC